MEEETVTLTKSVYDEMVRQIAWLAALENAGVDNWDGIDYAYELFNEENEEE